MKTVNYKVPAMHCGHCIHTVEMEVGELEGVREVKASLDDNTVHISFDDPANEDKIKSLLSEINYPVDGLLTIN